MADTLQKMQATSLREKVAAWEAKNNPVAGLTSNQRDTFIELTTFSSNRPLPLELPLDDFPGVNTLQSSSSSQDEDLLTRGFAALEMGKQKIENAQQFFLWYSEVEERMESEEGIQFQQYMEDLQDYCGECDQVLGEVSTALDYLQQLEKYYVHVSTKTDALHEACEHLLAEQTKLVNTAESINNKLSYFNELERISTKLGSPTLTVSSDLFVPMLSRLDECIAYINANAQYKESRVYLVRFEQCLSKALNLIRTHILNTLQNATQQVIPKKETTDETENAFTLFYGKFRTNAPRVKTLMEQIENRGEKNSMYLQLLTDCHTCYFTQRMTLLGPSVTSAINDLATKHVRDQCALMRSGSAFMVHVCQDEYQLYNHFFTNHTDMLDSMLEGLCNILYDVFRPLIIHINHLETLAELCSILKVEMLEEHVQNNSTQLKAFEVICRQMLEDVQERLVYRTHIYIKSDILNYKPASGDLAYPEKLQMMKEIAENVKKTQHNRSPSSASTSSTEVAQITGGDGDSDASSVANEIPVSTPAFAKIQGNHATNMPLSPADLHGMWYPTVRRTLVCLSKLYRCIDKTTFQGLSQEILSLCIQSLISASTAISKRKDMIDGELFLIKHLLILREQIAPFHVDFAVRETALDFSKIKDAAFDLLYAKTKLFALNTNNALLQFLTDGTPHVTETFIDSKKEVDNHLKKTCEDFIHHISEDLIGPLKIFLSKANVIVKMNKEDSGPKVSLRQQPFASPEKINEVVTQTYRNLKNKVPLVQNSMALYLANKDTEFILFKPIKVNIQNSFQQLHQMLSEEYSMEDQHIVACPSLEQINLLLSSSSK